MSTTKQLSNITPKQIADKGVQALANRPNVSAQYGVSGLSPTQLKLWFDKLANFLADKINELQNALSADEAAAYIRLLLDDYGVENLNDLVKSFSDGTFAEEILLVKTSVVGSKTYPLQTVISSFAQTIDENKESIDTIDTNISKLTNYQIYLTQLVNAVSNSKLNKIATDVDTAVAYVKLPDGTNTYKKIITDAEPDTIIYRDSQTGRAQIEYPNLEKDIANKKYVDDKTIGKVSKAEPSTAIQVYIMPPDGIEGTLDADIFKTAYTIVFRDEYGNAEFETPLKEYHAANKKYVDEKVAGIIGSAPETLDTLMELSKALGDDPNFATTIIAELGKKAGKDEVTDAIDSAISAALKPEQEKAIAEIFASKDYLAEEISKISVKDGADGKSAYQIAVENGYIGTETEWIASLHAANPKVLPMSQYATEAEAIAYMDSQTDHSINYVWNNKVYCSVSKNVTQLTGACLYGYRNSGSSGVVAAEGKSMYVIQISSFTAPLHIENYTFPISNSPYIYGGTAIPTFNKTLVAQDNYVGRTEAFDITETQLQNCTYIAFSVTTESQPTSASVTVNGTVIPLTVITSPSQIESAVLVGTTTVNGYVDSGVIYTAIVSSSSTQKYLDKRGTYMLPVPSGYCESHATYEAGTHYLTKYPYATMTEMFSALATSNSEYITETVLGKDQSNTYDIKSYVLDAQTSLKSGQTSAVISEKPVFIITSGLHGLEPDAVHTVYHFMQDLAENYYESDQLQYLHDNIRFVIIPICNPWGYVNQNYHNSRDVDLNKNFECGYRTNGTANTGTEANSEAETLLMKQVFDEYSKAIFHLECHGKYGVDTSFNKTIWFSLMQTLNSELIELNANKLNSQIGKRLFNLGYSTNKSTGGYITYYGLNGRPKDYTGTKYGILSGTMEGTGCIYSDTGYSVNTQKINCEALENFVLNVIDSLGSKVKVRNTDNEDTIASLDWYNGEVI